MGNGASAVELDREFHLGHCRYEISFTRYFHKPQPPWTLDEIRADIVALEKETEGLLSEVVGREEEDGGLKCPIE